MKKLIILTFIIVVMTACGNEDETVLQTQNKEQIVNDVEVANGQTEEQGTENEERVETNTNGASESDTDPRSFQSIIPSEWDITLPTDFFVTQGKYLTAIASSQQDVVTFEFYETERELAINDPNIKKTGQIIGHLVITKYATAEAASEEIDKTVFTDGETVNLGHGITGYQDAGAGSLFTSWNEGRWAIIARSTTEKLEESLATAKETVEFLETNRIPIPKQYGHLHIDTEHKGSLAKWQKQNLVYTLTDFGDKTLNWLVTFK
ncbi:hypothetical protein [Peribacillus huizhouensis]|uniref:Lipoprotein n=1 Tax=Peribacillus huizhouensis TaxID=1501239 RepID=A0ABR6CV83_9BACI|nr:hypothetical protein [Peribacillus huizhouensis]MBA9028242.1 hypothetical protein [Peribacillus huizhouensis]